MAPAAERKGERGWVPPAVHVYDLRTAAPRLVVDAVMELFKHTFASLLEAGYDSVRITWLAGDEWAVFNSDQVKILRATHQEVQPHKKKMKM
eukprot:gene43638-15024_t